MKKFALMVFLSVFVFTSIAHAESCEEAMKRTTLTAPAVTAKSITHVKGSDVVVIATANPVRNGTRFADSITVIEREYFPSEYEAVRKARAKDVALGIMSSVDGHGDPALFLVVFIQEGKECLYDRIGDRVYWRGGEFPSLFSTAVYEWEAKHPLDSLIDGRDRRIEWKE